MKASVSFACVMTVGSMMTMAYANTSDNDVIVITKQVAQNSKPIAIIPFVGDTTISPIVAANLDSEIGATQQNLPQRPQSSGEVLANINTWRNHGFSHVVVGTSHSIVGNKVATSYEIIDVAAARIIGGTRTQVSDRSQASLKHGANLISDEIYQAITGQGGDFGSKIAYIEETGTPNQKTSTLKIIDATGQNARTLFTVTGSILTPTFSPDGSRIAYAVQAKNALPVIHVQSVNGGASDVVTPFWGHNLSPSFSHDGGSLLFSGSHENNNPNIYRLDLASKTLTRLTNLAGAENSPNALADGSGFIYTADHGTRSQTLYRFDYATQKSTALGNGTNPSLSADGSKLIYVLGSSIVIAQPSGSTLQSIAAGGTEVSASFSPSANRIVYNSTQAGKSSLNIHHLRSGKSFNLPTQGVVREPIWSK